MREELDRAEVTLARIAGRQHGVVTVAQLRAVGIGKNGVTRWVRRGHLHRLHRGVYAVGHKAPSEYQRYTAAVLACGDGAALSHQSSLRNGGQAISARAAPERGGAICP